MALGTDFALCAGAQATFRETGLPRLVMRLITVQAIRASTFWADRVGLMGKALAGFRGGR
jgi:hypothetical protein